MIWSWLEKTKENEACQGEAVVMVRHQGPGEAGIFLGMSVIQDQEKKKSWIGQPK